MLLGSKSSYLFNLVKYVPAYVLQSGIDLGDSPNLIQSVADRPSRRIGDGRQDIILVVGVLGCIEDAADCLFFRGQIPLGIIINGMCPQLNSTQSTPSLRIIS